MKKTPLIIIFVVIALVLVAWWQFGTQKAPKITNFEECVAAGNPVMESYPRQCRHGDEIFIEEIESTQEVVSFSDKELGLSFDYPSRFGDVSVAVFEPGKRPGGETGEKLVGTFSEFSGLEFGGITDDFSAGREGLLTDTRGFLEENGKYYFKFVSAKDPRSFKLQPLKVIEKDFGKILLLNDQSFEAEREGVEGPVLGVGDGRLAGLMNLKSTKFPGIVFYNWNVAEFPLAEFEALLNSVRISSPELKTFTQTKGPVGYSIDVPFSWFPHENGPSVIFTQDSELDIPFGTEGAAIGPNFYIIVHNITDIEGVTTYEEWLDANGMTEKSSLFVESKDVNISGYEMKRVVVEGAGFGGEVLHYVYFVDIQRVVTLSQYPYDPDLTITQVFEAAVQTFRVPERQD